jgi:hypothetical protein
MSHVNLRDHFDLLRHEESVALSPAGIGGRGAGRCPSERPARL